MPGTGSAPRYTTPSRSTSSRRREAGADIAQNASRMPASASRDRDPLAGVTRLLVDGTNLLHALSRGPERQPPSAVIGRLRAAIPLTVAVEQGLIGPTERGLRGERIAQNLSVRFSGRFTADTVLISLVEEGSDDATLVVTDDRELRFAASRRGARTAGVAWLIRRLERPPRGTPPRAMPPDASAAEDDADARPAWSPGRGATRKRGNPRRTSRR